MAILTLHLTSIGNDHSSCYSDYGYKCLNYYHTHLGKAHHYLNVFYCIITCLAVSCEMWLRHGSHAKCRLSTNKIAFFWLATKISSSVSALEAPSPSSAVVVCGEWGTRWRMKLLGKTSPTSIKVLKTFSLPSMSPRNLFHSSCWSKR